LGAELSRRSPDARAEALQAHLCERDADLCLPEDAGELHKQLRSYLVAASDERLLATKVADVFRWLKLSPSPLGQEPEYMGIYGGEKDQKRIGDGPRFVRKDGAWCTFTITVRARRRQPLELVAYDFELCFPERTDWERRLPRFVRFDLNPPAHGNESKGLRCHMHPGHDDLIAPAPLMSPMDVLDLFVYGLVLPEHPRKA